MPHPIKKVYGKGTPGWSRKQINVTLNQIKREIRASAHPGETRRKFRERGLIA